MDTHALSMDTDPRPTKRSRTMTLSVSGPPPLHSDVNVSPPMPANIAQPSAPSVREAGGTFFRKENRTSKTLSCNECRRLKLKCDRIFPCQSCCKRGCAEICPDGALTSGKGSRFILANTEQLHDKIQQLSDRVRQLEEALEILQKQYSTQPHPLLTPDLLKIKSTFHVGHKDSQAINHVPNNGMNGADNGSKPSPTFYRSPESPDDRASRPASRSSSACPEVPPDLLELSSAFPVPWTIDLKLRKRIRESLPPFQTAQALCRATRENALWQFNLDASNTFLDNLLAHVYSTPIEDLSPRRLSLLLMNLAVGSVVSESESIGSHMGEAFHHLARASACEIPLTEAPDFDVVHTLFYMIWYQLSFSNNSNAVTLAWNTMGLTAKLAQGLGLHRDASRSKVLPEEEERKRAVFWELVNMDTRLSLSLGRPPSLFLTHIDAKPLTYQGSETTHYHGWKAKFLRQCLDPILQLTIQVEPPSYRQIVQADALVREFPTLELVTGLDEQNPRSSVMQHAVAVTGREIALLQLHRRYFLQALNNSEEFNLGHEHGPSVLATYLAASSLITSTQELFNLAPDLSARFLHFWFNIFSAGVALSLITIRAPSSRLSPHALQSLKRARHLFREVAKLLPFCAKALPVLDKLMAKAQKAYDERVDLIRLDTDRNSVESNARISTYFFDSHPHLLSNAQNLASQSRLLPVPRPHVGPGCPGPPKVEENIDLLPSAYTFNVLGLGTGDRLASLPLNDGDDHNDFAQIHPHPFAPCPPRIAENDAVNMECGAFTLELADTSYMAWF